MGSRLSERRRRAGFGLLVLLLGTTAARAQDAIPTDPVRISAEQIYNWRDRNEQIFLLIGNGKIEQGSTVLTVSRGIVWLNDQTKGLTNAYFFDVYGEEGISLLRDGRKQEGVRDAPDRAYCETNARRRCLGRTWRDPDRECDRPSGLSRFVPR